MLGSNPSATQVAEVWEPYEHRAAPPLLKHFHTLVLHAVNPGGLGAGPH
jgi:hypothetical protein